MFGLMLLYVCIGLLYVGLSIPLIQKKVKPNPWYGLRVPKTLNNEYIWYKANAYSGVLLFLAGLFNAAAAILLAILPGMKTETYVLWCTVVMMGSLLWAVVLSLRYLSKL